MSTANTKKSIKKKTSKKSSQVSTQVVDFLPLRDVVIFPESAVPLQISRPKSLALLDRIPVENAQLAVFTQREPNKDDPTLKDFHRAGCLVSIIKKLKFPDGTIRLVVQGQKRIVLEKLLESKKNYRASVRIREDVHAKGRKQELNALAKIVSGQYQKILDLVPSLPEELQVAVLNLEDPSRLADFISSTLNFSLEEKIELLETVDVVTRLRHLTELIQRELEMAQLGSKIQNEVQTQMTKLQREHFLREQLRVIREELGDQGDESAELEELSQKIKDLKLEANIETETLKEISRIEKLPPASSEAAQLRTWVECVAELPWNQFTQDNLDLKHARKILDQDHTYLDKVKERILEFLAVRQLKKNSRGSILCFAGPPGVGKTSLGRSIARAMNRKFVRMSVGGIHDEAEIRGHRRTYVGAMPGRILKELKNCGTRNPVFMLDEVDKMGRDYRGDPSSALLEVLDSEQNHSFQDNYLNFPFDLSEVFFICTVNRLDTIPLALRDRMEVISIEGYTLSEKVEIARKHLLPDQIKEHGLRRRDLLIEKKILQSLVSNYTREAGVRHLKRSLAALCRKAARRRVEGKRGSLKISAVNLPKLLDQNRVRPDKIREKPQIGVVTGMAWTSTGGMILNVEAVLVEGRRPILVTGSLGDVMKESARIAYTVVRHHLSKTHKGIEKKEVHLHVPAGAISKDGPSAGITMAVVLMSLLKKVPIDPGIAMTGELTLSGQVLPVGGIKSKVLAAQRAGVHTVILPKGNRDDFEDIPEDVRSRLQFKWVQDVSQVFKLVGLQKG